MASPLENELTKSVKNYEKVKSEIEKKSKKSKEEGSEEEEEEE